MDPFEAIQIGNAPVTPPVAPPQVSSVALQPTEGYEQRDAATPQQDEQSPALLTNPAPGVVGPPSGVGDLEVTPDLVSDFVRLFSTEVPEHVRRKTKTEVYARLDQDGPGYYLEEVARGAIPVEIAFRYEMPVVFFMRWLQDRADIEDYNYAMGLCADTLAAKSRAVLELSPSSTAEGQMIREYAKRALDLAERIAPDGWSGSKRPKTDTVGQVALQIAIVMPGEAVTKGRVIPGLELLQAGVRDGAQAATLTPESSPAFTPPST